VCWGQCEADDEAIVPWRASRRRRRWRRRLQLVHFSGQAQGQEEAEEEEAKGRTGRHLSSGRGGGGCGFPAGTADKRGPRRVSARVAWRDGETLGHPACQRGRSIRHAAFSTVRIYQRPKGNSGTESRFFHRDFFTDTWKSLIALMILSHRYSLGDDTNTVCTQKLTE